MAELAEWFLTTAERGNPASDLPAWCEGSRAEPLIHGATYFDQLVTEVEALGRGDYLFFTDWRGDPDQKMRDGGPTIAELFCKAARARRRRQGTDVALASGQVRLQRGGEPASGR